MIAPFKPHCSDPRVDECFAQDLRRAINRTRRFFLDHQQPDGHWVAELEGAARFQSETILLLAFLGEESERLAKYCANDLIATQLPDGGWAAYPGANADVHNTVKGYFALKLTGHDPGAEYMQRAHRKAMELGGADNTDGFTRLFLAILGQIPFEQCPAVPSSQWNSKLQKDSKSQWDSNMIPPSNPLQSLFASLSIISTLKPVRTIPAERGIRELFLRDPKEWLPAVLSKQTGSSRLLSRERLFGAFHWCKRMVLSREKTKQNFLRQFEENGGSPTSSTPFFSAILWNRVALRALGFGDDSDEVVACREQWDQLVVWEAENKCARVQPYLTPVEDTLLTLDALKRSGWDESHPAVRQGSEWIRSQRLVENAEKKNVLCAPPISWTADEVLKNPARSSLDRIGEALESLGRNGYRIGDHAGIDRCVSFLRKSQRPDGSWFGTYGVNFIYGTWKVLTGLSAVGVPNDDPMIVWGRNWLLAHQQSCGGWGESPDSYHDETLRGQGCPTASQTAWAIMGLLATGPVDSLAVYRGIRFLLERQCPDGTWNEPEFTGRDFSGNVCVKHHYYPMYFPLMALALFAERARVANVDVLESAAPTLKTYLKTLSFDPAHSSPASPNFPPVPAPKILKLQPQLKLFCG